MTYPLTAGGPDDYPVQPGSMLLTLVQPHEGYERAFNRWYERDHFYGGCMEGQNCLAGARWVATRELKKLRWPAGSDVADPYDNGSYIAIYWVLAGKHDEWQAWGGQRVRELYAGGRGFSERTHVHTNLYTFLGADYRDPDPTPVMLALDRHYPGMVAMWFDGLDGRTPEQSLAELRKAALPDMLKGSQVESSAAWAPIIPADASSRDAAPMKLGAGPGGPTRFCQLLFIDADPKASLGRLKAYAEDVKARGIAELRLAAPFIKTIVGTDTYSDQL